MASGGFSRDDQVLEAIFNPENPAGGLDVSQHIQHGMTWLLANLIAMRVHVGADFQGVFFR